MRQLESRRQSALLRCRESAKSGCEQTEQVAPLLDHLVGAGEQRPRHVEAKHPGGLGIDYQLELARLHDRQVGGLGTFENLAGVDAGLAVRVSQTGSVAHQAAGRGVKTQIVNRGHPIAGRQRHELITVASEERKHRHLSRLRLPAVGPKSRMLRRSRLQCWHLRHGFAASARVPLPAYLCHALQNDKADVSALMGLYAEISKMRVLSSA